MLKKYSNLTISPNATITSKKIESADKKITYQCLKVIFSGYESSDNFGRTNFQISLSEMTSNAVLSLYELNTTNIDNLTYSNIESYLGSQLSVFSVTKSEETIFEDVDIFEIIKDKKSKSSFTVYFAIKCDTNDSVNFSFQDITKEEVLTGELYNPLKESYIHRNIKQEISFVGTGVVDLFNRSLNFSLLNISTSGKEPVGISATYNENRSGIFGEHITADFEYQAKLCHDYIEIINSIGDAIYYQLISRDAALKKYGIEPYSADGTLFVNLTDLTYILSFKSEIVLVNKDNSKNVFSCNALSIDSIQSIYLTKIETDRMTIEYIRDDIHRVTSIRTNDNDTIKIGYNTYSTSGIVTKIEYDKMRYVKFRYSTVSSKKLLIAIDYCDNNNPTNNEIIHNTSCYEYIQTTPYKLSIAYDNLTKIGCKYEYTNNLVSKVTKILTESNDISVYTEIAKNGNTTKITNHLGEEKYFYFDNCGRCYMESDADGNISSTKYQKGNIGANPNIIGKSKLEKNENDILLNGDFEGILNTGEFEWETDSISNIKYSTSLGYNGKSSLRIYNIKTSNFNLAQAVNNVSNYLEKKLYLRGYVRGTGSITVNLKMNDLDNKVSIIPQNLWDEIRIDDISISSNTTSIKVIISISQGSDIRLSNFSLCVDGKCERDNFVQNGKFIEDNKKWSFDNFESADIVKNVTLSAPLNNVFKQHFEIRGNLTKGKELKQEIDVSGGAGEELLFSYFAKVNINNNDLCYSYIQIEYTLLGTKTYSFGLNTDVTDYQKISQSVITESAYKKVTIGIRYLGRNTAYFSDFGLYKEQFGTCYSFNEKSSLVEIAKGSALTNISQDSSSRVKRIVDATGEIFEYTYDEIGNITEIKDSSGNIFKFEYDSNSFLTKNTITTLNNKTMVCEQTNDPIGNVLTLRDYNGNLTAFEYDEKERIKIKNNSSGLVSHFYYDDKDNIIKKSYDIESTIINHNFSHNDANNISEISIENKSKYDFDLYDEWGSLKRVILDNKILNEFTYYKHDNIYTGLLSSKVYPNGTYHFKYDNLQRLQSVKYGTSTIVEYTYDKLGKLIKKVDRNGDTYYTYDSNGQLIKAHIIDNQTKKTFLMEYDNLGNIQQKSILLNDDTILNYNYAYKYEYNEYKSGGYFSRLDNSFNEDIIFEEACLKYGDEPVLNTVEISKDLEMNRNVFKFTKNTSSLAFLNSAINAKRIEKTSSDTLFNKEEWQKSFSKRKEMFTWVKINNFTTTESIVKILSMGNDTDEILSVSVGNTGAVLFNYNGQTIPFTNVNEKEWSLIGFVLEEIENEDASKNVTKLGVFVDNYYHLYDVAGNRLNEITRIMLGEYHNSSVTNKQLSGGTNLLMPFDIMYAAIGEYNHNEESYKGIYNEGYKYIFTYDSNPASGVIYYNHNAYADMDVIPLNGNLSSVKGLKPLEYTYGDSSFSVDKTKQFKLDRQKASNDTEYTSRHVYGSYKEDIGINGKNKSMLVYDFGLKKEGTISLRFKCDFAEGWDSETYRTIIACPSMGYESHKFIAYVDDTTQQIKVSYGGVTYNTQLNVYPNKWHLFTLIWNSSYIKINLDDQEYQDSLSRGIDLSGCKTYIGCNYLNGAPSSQLLGNIEMVSYSDKYNPTIHSKLKQKGKVISILTEYDEAERPYKKEINTGSTRLNHLYKYNDENNKINLYPSIEILPDRTSIVYSYDRSGNVVHKISIKDGVVGESIHYKYDVVGRIISEKCYSGNIFRYFVEYKYNNLGDILEKIEYNGNGDIIVRNVYTYSTEVKSQLLKIESFDANNTLKSIKNIAYSIDDPFRPTNYDNNVLTWEGRRLSSFGVNSYEYNNEGIRVSKSVGNLKTTYTLDGTRLVVEDKPDYNSVYYHYDENGEVVGFNYDENEYFYYRDLTGNITKIVDINGNVKVEYKYDAWGKVLDVTGDSIIIAVNSFLYKGYYYDSEIQMYYCKSRYYDPSTGRWISIDDSSYLEPETINGINLWSYCGNNPVMGYDPEGTWNWKKFWKGVARTVAIAVVAVVVAAVAVVVGMTTGAAVICAAVVTTISAVDTIITAAYQDDHYNRNENQDAFMKDKDAQWFTKNWDPVEQKQNIYHRHKNGFQGEDAVNNVKYMDPTGHMEVIICKKGEEKDYYIVTDPYNYGTYNYYNFKTNPVGHFFADVLPYWLWGNSPEDSGIEHMFRRIFGAKK